MEGTSYESRFFIYEGGDDDLASRIAMVLWLFEDELGRAALEALQKDEIVLYTREGVKIEHCSYLRPNDELLVSVRAAAVKKISQRASQRTSLREESAGASTDDDERAAELLPAQGGVGAPRVVTCSFFVNNMKKVDAIEGTVELDFQLYAQWVDPALAGVPVEERPPYREEDRRADDNRPLCWNPKLEVNNDVNLETLWSVFPPAYQGVDEGRVVWGARYRGAISNDMDLHQARAPPPPPAAHAPRSGTTTSALHLHLLHRLSHLHRPPQFPLDSDDILIRVGPKEYTDQDVVLEIDAKKHGTEGASGDRIKSSNLEEWELGNPSVRIERSGPTGSGNYYSNVVFCVCEIGRVTRTASRARFSHRSRRRTSRAPQVRPPQGGVLLLEDHADHPAARLHLRVHLLHGRRGRLPRPPQHEHHADPRLRRLLYVASESLPKISYLTLLDKMMLFSFIMLFATALESFVSYILIVWANRPAAAYWVDIGSAIAYPTLYVLYGLYLGTNAVAVRRKQKASEGGGGGGGGGGGATYSSTLPAVGGGDGDGDAGCCGALRPRRHRTPTLMMENAAPEAAPAKSVKQVSGV